jgi:hypothetical protein
MKVFRFLAPLLLVTLVSALAFPSAAAMRKLGNGSGPDRWAGDLAPLAQSDWTYERAAHLLERAGFGGTPEEVEKIRQMGLAAAVEYLVNYGAIDNGLLPPFEESAIFSAAALPDVDAHYQTFGDYFRAARERGEGFGVRPNPDGPARLQPVADAWFYNIRSDRYEWSRAATWWANRMINTRRPLEEKMTLYWHGHFATQNSKVNDYRLMLAQLDMLRHNATGNFRDLLLGIARDPAMLVYLDNRVNVKGHANENFAREIMELFSLGAGNYTEKDIKEAGRALTGWTNDGLRFQSKPELHDDGQKTILGETGAFDGEQVIDILLRQKAAAEFVSRKIYRFFVREEISPELNARLASTLRDSKYELKPLLRQIFLSKDFYSAPSFATQIKSPVFLAVSTYRKLGLTEIPGKPAFITLSSLLGQELGNPPNVKGWDGGRVWINPATLLERGNFVRHVLMPETFKDQYGGMELEEVSWHNQLAREMNGMQSEAMMGASPKSAVAVSRQASMADFDIALGYIHGGEMATGRVKPTPRTPAKIDLAGMVKSAGAKTSAEVVDYLTLRFLSLPLDEAARHDLIEYLTRRCGEKIDFASPDLERVLRELAHVIMNTPEFQLS